MKRLRRHCRRSRARRRRLICASRVRNVRTAALVQLVPKKFSHWHRTAPIEAAVCGLAAEHWLIDRSEQSGRPVIIPPDIGLQRLTTAVAKPKSLPAGAHSVSGESLSFRRHPSFSSMTLSAAWAAMRSATPPVLRWGTTNKCRSESVIVTVVLLRSDFAGFCLTLDVWPPACRLRRQLAGLSNRLRYAASPRNPNKA